MQIANCLYKVCIIHVYTTKQNHTACIASLSWSEIEGAEVNNEEVTRKKHQQNKCTGELFL